LEGFIGLLSFEFEGQIIFFCSELEALNDLDYL
jgi:hypothetical protein